MNDKRETLEDIARREKRALEEERAARDEYLQSAEKLAKEMPPLFFQFCDLLKAAVGRFNAACDPTRRLLWRESPALAARDKNLSAEFNLTFGRDVSDVTVSLNALGRSGKPDVYLVEVFGKLGPAADRFMMRIEGYVKKGKLELRVTVDFKRIEVPLQDLAERLVVAAVKGDYQLIFRG
jgi:hypothetical protein